MCRSAAAPGRLRTHRAALEPAASQITDAFPGAPSQEFAAARQYPGGCARVEAGAELRSGLLDEDTGPLAHAPRPASVGTVENIYTDTIYSKGCRAGLVWFC